MIKAIKFKDKVRAELQKLILKKLHGKKDPIINAKVIAALINELELTNQDAVELINIICKKTTLFPIFYTVNDLEFVFDDIKKKIKMMNGLN